MEGEEDPGDSDLEKLEIIGCVGMYGFNEKDRGIGVVLKKKSGKLVDFSCDGGLGEDNSCKNHCMYNGETGEHNGYEPKECFFISLISKEQKV